MKGLVTSNEGTMIRVCKSCDKEFQDFSEGVVYSTAMKGFSYFCSDLCCKNYLDSIVKK